MNAKNCLARCFLLQEQGSSRSCAAWRPTCAVTQCAYVKLQFGYGAAERVAMHAELAGGLALVAVILLEHGEDEPFFEFAYRLGVEDSALVHLQDECFQLILHDVPLSDIRGNTTPYFDRPRASGNWSLADSSARRLRAIFGCGILDGANRLRSLAEPFT